MKDQFERLSVALRGRYTLERQLGKGGMGTVYLGRDVKLGREVAIKVLLPEVRAVLGTERFQREVRLVSKLSHPHIVKLFEADEADGIPFYAMDFVEGESLQQRLERQGQIGLKEALRITSEIGDALQYAHEHGTIHRDIKPGNILLSGDHALLTDFGIAKETAREGVETLTDTGVAIGTAPYMSPEQAAGDKRLDERSDVYSLAAVLYEMLAGEPPFTGKTYQAIVARVMMDAPRPLHTTRSNVPAHVEQAILDALAKSPADRPPTPKDFLARLSAATNVAPVKRRRALAILVAVTVTVTVVLGGWMVSRVLASGSANSIAVLYFDNVSGDSANTYLADGLTEELTTRLGQSRLVVKSRNSVRRYRGETVADPATMGRALGVEYLLSGSVRGGAKRGRIVVELTQTRTGTMIWGDSYDIMTTDPLEIQKQIAVAVTGRLVGQLSGVERASLAAFPTRSREAYDHFLRGLYYMGPRDQPGLFRALDQFESAVRLDPTFARAFARIGITCVLIIFRSEDSAFTARYLAQGTAAINRALVLDSTISDAWLGRGRLLAIQRGPFDEGVRTSYERAIALDSMSADAHHFYAINLWYYWGESKRALEELRAVIALEPDRLNTLNTLGFAESVARHPSEALKWWDSVVALQPTAAAPALIGAHVNRATERLMVLKDTIGAQHDVDEINRLGNPGASHDILALLEVRRGDTAAALIHLNQAWAMGGWSDTRCGPLEAAVDVELGEHDRALDCVEHISREEFPFLFPYLLHPFFDPIRTDARFQKVIDRLRPPQRTQTSRAP